MANQKNAAPKFLDSDPDALERASHSPYDSFRDACVENKGKWALLGAFDDRGSAQSRASVIRNGRGRWANGTYEARLAKHVDDETGEQTSKVAVYVRYTGPAQPKPEAATGETQTDVDENGQPENADPADGSDPYNEEDFANA